jgi:hypothetical protein
MIRAPAPSIIRIVTDGLSIPNLMDHDIAPQFELLESRRMLASITVLIHGHQGTTGGWVSAAADAIAQRVGERQTSQYILKITNNSGDLAVESFTLDEGPGLRNSTTGEAIVKLDWTDVDNGDYSTTDVGEVVGEYLLKSHGDLPALAGLPLHLVGHSRGGSMVSAISRYLGAAGVWVEQNTFLDPVAVEELFGFGYDDLPLRVYSNVIFADNYWRDDGNRFDADPDGQDVDGAHNVDLDDTVQEDHVVSAHMGVTAYYHGTIDTDAVFNRDHPVLSDWYGDGEPERDETGFYFSRLVGGARPKEGLSPDFSGSADRRDAGDDFKQWSNIGDVRVVGGRTFAVGERIKTRLKLQDGDSNTRLTIYLDRDRNPLNNNHVRTMRRATVAQRDEVTSVSYSGSSGGIEPGSYYVFAKVTDSSGGMRFAYSRRITLTAPATASAVVPPSREIQGQVEATRITTIAMDLLSEAL